MKAVNVLAVLVTGALVAGAGRGFATEYANNPNPACRLMGVT
jgi:hypothetical protein